MNMNMNMNKNTNNTNNPNNTNTNTKTNLNEVHHFSPRYEPIKHDISMCNIDTNQQIGGINNEINITHLPKNVLIVDDVLSIRKILLRLFRSHNITCDEAENGQEALNKIIINNSYDLILMDYEMPVLNGPKCVSELRKRGIETIIIGITGNVLPDEINYFKQQGVDDVLLKPINYNVLIDTFDKISQSKYLLD